MFLYVLFLIYILMNFWWDMYGWHHADCIIDKIRGSCSSKKDEVIFIYGQFTTTNDISSISLIAVWSSREVRDWHDEQATLEDNR